MPLIETKGAASAQGFGEFAKVGAANYIEDVFSTYLYTGNGYPTSGTQTITNGIDLSTKGGLVWIKQRNGANGNVLFDTNRGAGNYIFSNLTSAQANASDTLTAFNSSGFSLGTDSTIGSVNENTKTYASWTFREQPKFFDVVTYTGNGANRTIAHNLGSVPGCIIVKRTDTTGDWQVYHRSLANTEYMVLNSTAAKATGATRWNSTTPTATEFSLGTDATVNASGGTYVAYIFAHDAGGFGLTGTDNVISCGSYTGNGSATGPTITLGYEPQWIMLKNTNNGGTNWAMLDNMRGMPVGSDDQLLSANTSGAEVAAEYISPTSTGFNVTGTFAAVNENGSNIIYIAIRRGPMKTPTTGTSIYNAEAFTGTGATRAITTLSAPDMAWIRAYKNAVNANTIQVYDRLRGNGARVRTGLTNAEGTNAAFLQFNNQMLATVGNDSETNGSGASNMAWSFKRAPGFFDVVCYTGTGVARTVSHNLGVVPELMIVKSRSNAADWRVYAAGMGPTKALRLNDSATPTTNNVFWNDTSPTSTVFTVNDAVAVNLSGYTYVAYLFASCPGVSKVGSYTGSGTTKQIDCGFTGGARFVLIRRTDDTGDWYVWDSARGIVTADDPYLLLNSTAAEVTNTDYVDTYSAGFEISSTAPAGINANGGSFIFLAIA